MARVNDVVLLDHPADHSGPRSINCYLVEVRDFTTGALGGEGKKFKIVPERLIYSLQWQHKAEPPDFELVLLRDPELWERWVNAANLTLLAELRRRAPHAIDWTAMGDVVPILDEFEAARASQTARHH